jgi:hypothetical protein
LWLCGNCQNWDPSASSGQAYAMDGMIGMESDPSNESMQSQKSKFGQFLMGQKKFQKIFRQPLTTSFELRKLAHATMGTPFVIKNEELIVGIRGLRENYE